MDGLGLSRHCFVPWTEEALSINTLLAIMFNMPLLSLLLSLLLSKERICIFLSAFGQCYFHMGALTLKAQALLDWKNIRKVPNGVRSNSSVSSRLAD